MILLSILTALIWQDASYSPIVDGYSNKLSGFPGDSVILYFNAGESNPVYSVSLYDMQGKIVAKVEANIFPQAAISVHAYEIGYNYKPSAKIRIPDLKSGLYLWENKIPFIVKSRSPRIIVLYSSNTENAYNNAGGKSLYGYNSSQREASVKVSFRRPAEIERFSEAFFRWLIKQDFTDVGFVCDMDMDEYREISKANLLIITGHSEYWTHKARKNFDRFVADGKNALILSGNTMWWQVRYNKNRDQLQCYRKASLDKIKSSKLKTILWNDSTLAYPILTSIGAEFSRGGYGDQSDNGWDGYKIIKDSPLLEGTGLKKGDILSLTTREADGAPITMENGIPVFDNSALHFFKSEIIGFDHVLRGKEGIATWIVFKPTENSGTVINVASTNWCAYNGIGRNQNIDIITKTMINKLLNKENVFTPNEKFPPLNSESKTL